jgi:hypothetical protein
MPAESKTGDVEGSRKKAVELIFAALTRNGLLLKQDKSIPNVVGIITGESLHASWWSHPKSHLIYSVLTRLADDPRVLFAKLLDRKDTLIHTSLWPALLAVGTSHEHWQLKGLSASATNLLDRVDRGRTGIPATGPVARALQVRLLGTAREVHSESGRHELLFESWPAWSRRVGCKALKSSAEGRQVLELAAAGLGAPLKALPWRKRS